MRTLLPWIILGFAAIVPGACGGDDDSGGGGKGGSGGSKDAGKDSRGGKAGDSSTSDAPSGDAEAGQCSSCPAVVQGANPASLCDSNGPPSSAQLFQDILTCTCKPENCATACEATCKQFVKPDGTCIACAT